MASGNVAFLLGFGVEAVFLLVSASFASVEYYSAGDYVVNVVSCHIFSFFSEEEAYLRLRRRAAELEVLLLLCDVCLLYLLLCAV